MNEGFGKEFHRKGDSLKRSGPFSEPSDSENRSLLPSSPSRISGPKFKGGLWAEGSPRGLPEGLRSCEVARSFRGSPWHLRDLKETPEETPRAHEKPSESPEKKSAERPQSLRPLGSESVSTGAEKASCGETVVQKGVFGESVSSLHT